MPFPQLFDPSGDRTVTAKSTVFDFFQDWYEPTLRNDKTRKPISDETLDRRKAAVKWWKKLMGSGKAAVDDSPMLKEITQEHLAEFKAKLTTATWKRGGIGSKEYPLAPMTQKRTMQELHIVLAAAGPKDGKKVRADLIAAVPEIYLGEVNVFPKSTWTLDEAVRIAKAASTCDPPNRWKLDRQAWHLLGRATIAFLFYTGHRATTYEQLNRTALHEIKPGLWCLDILTSVKTGKIDRIPAHRQLLAAIKDIEQHRRLSLCTTLIPWPVKYGAVADYHTRWQEAAGLPENRTFSPQAWRRLHGEILQQSVHEMANRLASQSLGHSDVNTTQNHYTLNAARLYMPDLFSRQQRLF